MYSTEVNTLSHLPLVGWALRLTPESYSVIAPSGTYLYVLHPAAVLL